MSTRSTSRQKRVLWVEDDWTQFDDLVAPVAEICSVEVARDLSAASTIIQRDTDFDLFIVDLIIPEGRTASAIPRIHPYHGLSFIYALRHTFRVISPVLALTVVRDDPAFDLLVDLDVDRVLVKGTLLPADLADNVNALIQISDSMSVRRAIAANDPVPMGIVTSKAAYLRLGSRDRTEVMLGVQAAPHLGGRHMVRALVNVLLRFPRDLDLCRMAIDSLHLMLESDLWERSYYDPLTTSSQPGLVAPAHREGGVEAIHSGVGDQFVFVGSRGLEDICNGIEEAIRSAVSLDEIGKKEALEDFVTFKGWIATGPDDPVEPVAVLTRLKVRLPELAPMFIALTAGAGGNALGTGLVSAIRYAFGG